MFLGQYRQPQGHWTTTQTHSSINYILMLNITTTEKYSSINYIMLHRNTTQTHSSINYILLHKTATETNSSWMEVEQASVKLIKDWSHVMCNKLALAHSTSVGTVSRRRYGWPCDVATGLWQQRTGRPTCLPCTSTVVGTWCVCTDDLSATSLRPHHWRTCPLILAARPRVHPV